PNGVALRSQRVKAGLPADERKGGARPVPAQDDKLISFIGSAFRSVWALELLYHLRKVAGGDVAPEAPVASLRASELGVRRSLDELVAVGLVSVADDGKARYAPATRELDTLAGRAEERYARSPDAVRRIIVKAANPGLTAFSDAFRLGGSDS